MIEKKQILEWTENPVTVFLAEKVKEELKKVQKTPCADCLNDDPYKTQMNVLELQTRERMWTETLYFLEGDWEYFDESFGAVSEG